MPLPNPLTILSASCAVLGVILLILTVSAVRKKKAASALLRLVTGLLFLTLSSLFATIFIAIAGYQALTREELAATVSIVPAGPQQFIAKVRMPDGSQQNFRLKGDQLYVDAHILKWKPYANILGLHTSYELDRVSGRYADLNDEQTKPRTVFSLAKDKPVDLFALRQKFAWLSPVLDAEYGSATFINTSCAVEFKVMVSTTGLLIRTNESGAANAPAEK